MRAYVITTGVCFALIAVVHVWRIAEEGSHLIKEPFFVGATALAVVLALWAWRVSVRPKSQTL